MRIVSFGPAAIVAAPRTSSASGYRCSCSGMFGDVGVGTLLLALAVCVPAYALALWLGAKVLMLDVLRA